LAFHKIGDPPSTAWTTWNYVPVELFEFYIATLVDEGWKLVDRTHLLSMLDDSNATPGRTALITFDDGYLSTLHHALPVLQKYECPAIVFVPTDYVGGTNAFDLGIEPDERICDWNDLRKLEAGGVSVQAHSRSHPHLSRLSPDAVREELTSSKRKLEEQLGISVDLLAYPYGDHGNPVLTGTFLAELGYLAAFGYGGGVNAMPAQDHFRLNRLAMGPDSDLMRLLSDFSH
jgi:peptidoglycan/xylan/chitin deacetylase (PgdA/CDA1 family)